MNSLGRLFRVSVFGESHGACVGVTLDGTPAGIPLDVQDFTHDLDRRKAGAVGTTPRKEDDIPEILSGVFNGVTTGSPITIIFRNNNTQSKDYKQRSIPRPGHADFVASKKFGGFEDFRGGGHFSGRLTVTLVAAGVIAKKILKSSEAAVSVNAKLIEAGGMSNIDAAVEEAVNIKDSIGGIVECSVEGLPIALGEPFFDSVESMISHAVFAIPAVRGIEFGSGFKAAKMHGSEHNDALESADGKTATNHAGGVVGGLTNGNPLIFRIAIKPTSSTPKEQKTLNLESGKAEAFTVAGRHDLCIALRVPVVLEAVTSFVLADFVLIHKTMNIRTTTQTN